MIHARGFGGMLPKMIFEMIDAIWCVLMYILI